MRSRKFEPDSAKNVGLENYFKTNQKKKKKSDWTKTSRKKIQRCGCRSRTGGGASASGCPNTLYDTSVPNRRRSTANWTFISVDLILTNDGSSRLGTEMGVLAVDFLWLCELTFADAASWLVVLGTLCARPPSHHPSSTPQCLHPSFRTTSAHQITIDSDSSIITYIVIISIALKWSNFQSPCACRPHTYFYIIYLY